MITDKEYKKYFQDGKKMKVSKEGLSNRLKRIFARDKFKDSSFSENLYRVMAIVDGINSKEKTPKNNSLI